MSFLQVDMDKDGIESVIVFLPCPGWAELMNDLCGNEKGFVKVPDNMTDLHLWQCFFQYRSSPSNWSLLYCFNAFIKFLLVKYDSKRVVLCSLSYSLLISIGWMKSPACFFSTIHDASLIIHPLLDYVLIWPCLSGQKYVFGSWRISLIILRTIIVPKSSHSSLPWPSSTGLHPQAFRKCFSRPVAWI